MSENRDFGFCPKCGALMQNGVCRSCGYGQTIRTIGNDGTVIYQNPPGAPPKKNRKGLIIGLSIGGGVLLLFALIAAFIFFYSSVLRLGSETQDPFGDSYEDFYGDEYYGEEGYGDLYVPDAEDPYYVEITDAVDSELSYDVYWQYESLRPDDTEDFQSYDCTYPVLKGENEEIFDAINSRIAEMALAYEASFANYEGGCSSTGYVTYMDEEKISVVIQHSLYGQEYTEPRLAALTFSVETGESIPTDAMLELDADTAMRFRAQNKVQNSASGMDYLEKITDEELLSYLRDPENAVFFYTPVGLEVGFNYEDGWITVTFKDNPL